MQIRAFLRASLAMALLFTRGSRYFVCARVEGKKDAYEIHRVGLTWPDDQSKRDQSNRWKTYELDNWARAVRRDVDSWDNATARCAIVAEAPHKQNIVTGLRAHTRTNAHGHTHARAHACTHARTHTHYLFLLCLSFQDPDQANLTMLILFEKDMGDGRMLQSHMLRCDPPEAVKQVFLKKT